jgi:hypothetical protein
MTPNPTPPPSDLRDILAKILEEMTKQRETAAKAAETRKANAKARAEERERRNAPTFWGGAVKALVAATGPAGQQAKEDWNTGKRVFEGLAEMRQALLAQFSKAPDWWKPPANATAPVAPPQPALPQVHKATPPTSWQTPTGPPPVPPSNPGQGWSWQTPPGGPAPVPTPTAWPTAQPPVATPTTSWQTPMAPGAPVATPWAGSTGIPAAAGPIGSGASPSNPLTADPSGQMLQLMQRQTALMERMAQRLDEIASDSDDTQGTQGLEHESTRPTSGPTVYGGTGGTGSAGWSGDSPTPPPSLPQADQGDFWKEVGQIGRVLLGVR